MRPIKEIIIHCAATPEGKEFTAADIDRWHRELGWRGIGYHFVVRLDGTIEPGRPIQEAGAHTQGRNADTIGICYIGGIDAKGKAKDTRTPAQTKALRALCMDLIQRYPTITTISGHNQYAAKACPSFDVRRDPLGSLIAEMKAAPPAAPQSPSIEELIANVETALATLKKALS